MKIVLCLLVTATIGPRTRLWCNSSHHPGFRLSHGRRNVGCRCQFAEKFGDSKQCVVGLGVCWTLQSNRSWKMVLAIHQFLFCWRQPHRGLRQPGIQRTEKACWIWWVFGLALLSRITKIWTLAGLSLIICDFFAFARLSECQREWNMGRSLPLDPRRTWCENATQGWIVWSSEAPGTVDGRLAQKKNCSKGKKLID